MCDDPSELTSIRRTALITYRLAHGEALSVRQVVQMTGLTPSGARNMLRAISNVLPVYYDAQERAWQLVTLQELL